MTERGDLRVTMVWIRGVLPGFELADGVDDAVADSQSAHSVVDLEAVVDDELFVVLSFVEADLFVDVLQQVQEVSLKMTVTKNLL
jgi:hypothetical protein